MEWRGFSERRDSLMAIASLARVSPFGLYSDRVPLGKVLNA